MVHMERQNMTSLSEVLTSQFGNHHTPQTASFGSVWV